MSKQIQEAYIVAATRTPVGKAPRGMFRNTRLLAHMVQVLILTTAMGIFACDAFSKDNEFHHIEGGQSDEPIAAAALFFIAPGPVVGADNLKSLQASFLEQTVGAYYRVGLLSAEKYTDFAIELVAIGPEEWRKVMWTRVFSGEDISSNLGDIEYQDFEFVKWIDKSSFELKATSYKHGSLNLKIRVLADGAIDISKSRPK